MQRVIDYKKNIEAWGIPIPNQDYKVVIHCSTYNHENFIENTLKGFVCQITNFKYCAIIIDDASTDKTAMIIKEYEAKYPELIKGIYLQFNHMQNGLARDPYFTPWHECAQYIAECEGDDCWIDNNKLQLQIDLLDNNPHINITAHNALVVTREGSHPFNKKIKEREYSLPQVLLMKWFTPTASLVYRHNFTRSSLWKTYGANGDMANLYSNLLVGRLYYFDRVMSVYNYDTPSSFSHHSSKEILYQKRIGMYKALNAVSRYKYFYLTLPLLVYYSIKKRFHRS